jgi:hypothetical protein
VTRGPESTTRPGPGPRFRVRLRHRAALLPGCRVGAGCDVQWRARRDGPFSSFLTRGILRFLPEERDLSSFLQRGLFLCRSTSARSHVFAPCGVRTCGGDKRRPSCTESVLLASVQRDARGVELLVRCSCAAHALLMRCTEGVLLASVQRDALIRSSHAAPALLMRCSYTARTRLHSCTESGLLAPRSHANSMPFDALRAVRCPHVGHRRAQLQTQRAGPVTGALCMDGLVVDARRRHWAPARA